MGLGPRKTGNKAADIKHIKVMMLIRTIRENVPNAVQLFTHGQCYGFYLILKSVFSSSECYYNSDHAITRIGDHYYDITGETHPTNHIPLDSDPLVKQRLIDCTPNYLKS